MTRSPKPPRARQPVRSAPKRHGPLFARPVDKDQLGEAHSRRRQVGGVDAISLGHQPGAAFSPSLRGDDTRGGHAEAPG